MMQTMDMKGIYETWEKAASTWFDTWSKSPAFLSAVGKTMEAQLGMKSGMDKWTETMLETWKIPSRADMEAMAERIATLEERVADLEDQKAAPAAAPAPAAKK